ncbi:hypothetical protein [Streptosporangium sp. NPDC048865]
MQAKELIVTAVVTVTALFCVTPAAYAGSVLPPSVLSDTPWD